jgi:hypothetical protein
VRLLVDEHIRADSVVVRTYLALKDDKLQIDVEPGTSGALSIAAVVHVVRRYARPLDDEVIAGPELAAAPRLELPGGSALAVLHWRAAVDAAGRDWLVLTSPGTEPLAALAGGVAAALRYLVARLDAERA